MHPQKTMVLPMILYKLFQCLLCKILANSCYRAATKVKNHGFFLKNQFQISPHQTLHPFPNVTKCTLHNRKSQTIVCDIQGTLIRSESFFPFFMLVAFEGGSLLRAFLLLLSCPFLCVLDLDMKIKVMTFITFCGLRSKSMSTVVKAVLPKFYMENVNLNVYKVLASAECRMVFTRLPRIMVEGFLKDYLSFEIVKGSELHAFGDYYTGLLSGSGLLVKHKALMEFCGEKKPHVGLGTSSPHDQPFISLCKEAYVITKEDSKSSANLMPREKYPKPLIFHDGRLAFLPTPMATVTMFLWLPLGIILAIFRLVVGICLPYKLALFLGCASGVNIRLKGHIPPTSKGPKGKGVLYVCTHRTLLDPVFLSTSLRKPLTAVTYSLSKMSEFLSPIKTVRLTRDRKEDGVTMDKLLREGDLVVCPEGTTCREPYLLRFSSLFAELAEEIVPVAMNTNVTMFYGTTASGLKCLDPIFFLMNPRPCYCIQILEKLPKELTVGGGKSSHEVANYIQKQLGDALGFECTSLTRRDKYLMLAGNEGVVQDRRTKS